MRLGTQLRTLFFLLVGVQVVTALSGMALLGRMGPAIGGIVADNERSMYAAEQMLAVLANPNVAGRSTEQFMDGLHTAQSNITEQSERPVLAQIRRQARAAIGGEPQATRQVTQQLLALARINRTAMRRADADAQRLVLAGRWALALLALFGLLASVVAMRRARQKVLTPLADLAGVVTARRSGELHRRCHLHNDTELARVLLAYNELLDEIDRAHAPKSTATETALRSAMALVLDRLGGPRILLDRGEMVAMSTEAMDRVAEAGPELREAMRSGELDTWVEAAEEVGGTTLQLVTLRPEPA